MNHDQDKKYKIAFVFVIQTILFLILVFTLFKIVSNNSKFLRLESTERDRAIRGDILTKSHYTLATSKKLYTAQVDTRCIDPNKKDLFIKLFSIFSKIDEYTIKEKLDSNFGYVNISVTLDSKSARYLKQLRYNLNRYRVFQKYTDPKSGYTFTHGLSIIETGEFRHYPLNDTFSPYLGFMQKELKNGYQSVWGKYGLEKYYNEYLEGIQSTLIQGRKDVHGNIILDKNSEVKSRVDGYDVITSITLNLQKRLEKILDRHQKRLQAKEIIAAIMDSQTGNILALASSRRFNPNRITASDVPNTNISAVRYVFEPGSVMKTITYALLLQEHLIHPNDIVNVEKGVYFLGKKRITDEHRYEYLSTENIIVHSSNIGMAKLSKLLDPISFFKGLRDFGFARKSGIDLSDELSGSIPNIHQFKNSVFKATASYGYGMRVNFFQLLQAYNVFNNDGKLLKPSIGEYFDRHTSPIRKIHKKKIEQILDPNVAQTIQRILIKTVQKGTGQAAITPGIEVGGKTGTAQIAKRNVYQNLYNSSFFGFANDASHRYTLGVTVIEPLPKNSLYFASKSAVPVFKEMVEMLIEEEFLKRRKENE